MADVKELGRAYTRTELATALGIPEGQRIERVVVDHLRDLTIVVLSGENFCYRPDYDAPELVIARWGFERR